MEIAVLNFPLRFLSHLLGFTGALFCFSTGFLLVFKLLFKLGNTLLWCYLIIISYFFGFFYFYRLILIIDDFYFVLNFKFWLHFNIFNHVILLPNSVWVLCAASDVRIFKHTARNTMYVD